MQTASLHVLWLTLMIAFELFESRWQRASTLLGVLENVRRQYHRSLFRLLGLHPSFWFCLWLYFGAGVHGPWMAAIVVMKGSDIAFKLWMVQKLEKDELSGEMRLMLQSPLAPWMPWLNVVVYPPMLALAIG
ncbi:hypothetical protein [Hydrogenimonas sp.]